MTALHALRLAASEQPEGALKSLLNWAVLDELSGRFTDPAKLAADLPTWENGDDPLVGGGLISRGVVDFATVGIWPTKPAPSVPDGHVHVHVSGSTGSGKSAVAGEIEIAMRAIGLDVEWVDSESEKHLTHADYTSALELYRPKVRIFEKNISRTAPPAPSVSDGWKHDCAGILQNDVELWVDSCPHCGKPRPAAPAPAEAPADVARKMKGQQA